MLKKELKEVKVQLKEAQEKCESLRNHVKRREEKYAEKMKLAMTKNDYHERHVEGLKAKLEYEHERRFDWKEYNELHENLVQARSEKSTASK